MSGDHNMHQKDCYGDGNVYRGERTRDSEVKTVWVGLTDDEIFKADDMVPCHLPAYKRILMFGKILEVRLKEKNDANNV